MVITAMALSHSGRLIASGQLGTSYSKIPEAPVILWDLTNRKSLNVYKGLKKGVKLLEFSHDDQFLAAVGFDNVFVIWSVSDFSVVYNRVFEWPVELCSTFTF